MSHPDPHAPPDRTPIQIGEVWENPVTGERATILELPHQNPERRVVGELLALVGARVIGEHCHPGIVERFTVLEGELTMKRGGTDEHSPPRRDRHHRTRVYGTTGGMQASETPACAWK
jgi:hypothetical protein